MTWIKFTPMLDDDISDCWDTMEPTICDLLGPTDATLLSRYETHGNSYKLIFEVLSLIIIAPNNKFDESVRKEMLRVVAPLLLDKLERFYYPSVRSHIEQNLFTKKHISITLLGNVILPVLSNKEATLLDIFSVIMLMFAINPDLPTVQEDSVFVKRRYMTALSFSVKSVKITSAEYMSMNNDSLSIKTWMLKCLNLEDTSLEDLSTDKWVGYVFNAIKYLGLCGLFAHQSRYTFTDGYSILSKTIFDDLMKNVV